MGSRLSSPMPATSSARLLNHNLGICHTKRDTWPAVDTQSDCRAWFHRFVCPLTATECGRADPARLLDADGNRRDASEGTVDAAECDVVLDDAGAIAETETPRGVSLWQLREDKLPTRTKQLLKFHASNMARFGHGTRRTRGARSGQRRRHHQRAAALRSPKTRSTCTGDILLPLPGQGARCGR